LTSEEVVERLERIVREKMQSLGLH
jgi:hypothetical protein